MAIEMFNLGIYTYLLSTIFDWILKDFADRGETD